MRLPTLTFCITLLLIFTTQTATASPQPSGIMSVSALSKKSNKSGGEKLLTMPLGPQHNGVTRTKKSKKNNSINNNNNNSKTKSKTSTTGSKRFTKSNNDVQTEAKLFNMMHEDSVQGHGSTLNNNDNKNDFMSQHQTWLTQEGAAGKMMDSFRNDPAYAVSEKHPQHGIQMPDHHHHHHHHRHNPINHHGKDIPIDGDMSNLGHRVDHGHLQVMDTQTSHKMDPTSEWGLNGGQRKPDIPFHSPHIHQGMPPHGMMIGGKPHEKRSLMRDKYTPAEIPRWNNHEREGLRWKNGLDERRELPNFLKSESHPVSHHPRYANQADIYDNIKIRPMSPHFPSHHVPKDELMPKVGVEQEGWYSPHQTSSRNFQHLRVGYPHEE